MQNAKKKKKKVVLDILKRKGIASWYASTANWSLANVFNDGSDRQWYRMTFSLESVILESN